MRKPRYRTSAETNRFSWVFEKFVSNKVKHTWSASSDNETWWLAVTGASWDRPEGPGSYVWDRLDYPVVHVSYVDASAYCHLIGKRLPTEDEWEFAARAHLQGVTYPWGDKYEKGRMNVWQGTFPDEDEGYDGFKGLSPVDAYPPQNNNTMYDMLGNVWEWTSTRYYQRVIDRKLQDVKYVLKGGSYLDSREIGKRKNINQFTVRTSNRMGQVPAYTAHNVGFRCAASAPQLVRQVMREKDPKYKKQTATTKRMPRLHKFEEMAFPSPKRNRRLRNQRAKLKEFMEKKDRQKVIRSALPREEL